jgi:ABC-type proline/glycine betaine transport system ATPase subunit
VTHDIREAVRIGTRIILLKNGKIDWIAPAEDFGSADTDEAKAFLRTYA